jgi:hypothetical protein
LSAWLVTGSPENFGRTRDLGFSVQGFKSRQRKKVLEQMRPGDGLVYYLSGVQAFGGTVTIQSEGYEDHEVIWQSKPGEDYPFRVKISPDVVLEEEQWVPSEVVAPGLAYVQKWPAEHWKLAFQGNLRQIPDEDYAALRQVIAAARKG